MFMSPPLKHLGEPESASDTLGAGSALDGLEGRHSHFARNLNNLELINLIDFHGHLPII